jgi:segregation and condensation protein A
MPQIDFRVDLNLFRGPLDLLLYLVKKHEVEIVDIPIAEITDQYLQYFAVLEQLDVNAVGDFLAMASLLIEIKSNEVLPRGDEVEEEIDDPRQELVRRLLEYKKYRDAASILEERSRLWQEHCPRLSIDLPGRVRDLSEEPIQEAELWDLVSAFGRIMRESAAIKPSNIIYDDTPIRVYMARIHARLIECRRMSFRDLFQPSMIDSVVPGNNCPDRSAGKNGTIPFAATPGIHKSALIGIFLAVLELIRHHNVTVDQNSLFGEIWIAIDESCTEPLDFSDADEYENVQVSDRHGERSALAG